MWKLLPYLNISLQQVLNDKFESKHCPHPFPSAYEISKFLHCNNFLFMQELLHMKLHPLFHQILIAK